MNRSPVEPHAVGVKRSVIFQLLVNAPHSSGTLTAASHEQEDTVNSVALRHEPQL